MRSDDRPPLRRAAGRIRRRARKAMRTLRWLAFEFIRAPRFEVYAQRQNRENRRFFRTLRAEQREGREVYLEPYHPREIPKTLWIYWAQGEADAPYIVRRAIASWRELNPGWDVRVLDAEAADALVDTSEVPDCLPHRFRADLLRLRLLRRFGGVWADATLLCHRPLDDWLPLQAASGFFVFSNPGPDRWLDNWFIASEPDGILVTDWERTYANYVARCTRKPRRYFMTMYAFQWRVLTDGRIRAAWRRTATLPAPPTFLLMSALKGHTPIKAVEDALRAGLPLSKLSWKADLSEEEIGRTLDSLEQRPSR